MRLKAAELVRHLSQKDWGGEAAALHSFVQNKIRYVRDIRGVETLHPAEWVLRNGTGDCDDKALLVASLLEAIGHPTRFVAIGFKPDRFCHVYTETKIGNKWLAIETTEPVKMGWSPPNVRARLVIHN